MAEYILEVKDLGISFGGLKAAQDVNIHIKKNQIYGLIGPNGAGKTTIFNMLTGVYKPTTGTFYLDGQELHLTPIEYKLLCLLSRNVGKVLTHSYITQNIWGRSWDKRRGLPARVHSHAALKSWSPRPTLRSTSRRTSAWATA